MCYDRIMSTFQWEDTPHKLKSFRPLLCDHRELEQLAQGWLISMASFPSQVPTISSTSSGSNPHPQSRLQARVSLANLPSSVSVVL